VDDLSWWVQFWRQLRGWFWCWLLGRFIRKHLSQFYG